MILLLLNTYSLYNQHSLLKYQHKNLLIHIINNTLDCTNDPQMKSKNRHKYTSVYLLILKRTKFINNNVRQFASNSEIGNTSFFIFILCLCTCAR